MFLKIPIELLEQILDCDFNLQDKWNLARTSHQHYNVFKPLVWKKVKLTKKHLVSSTIDTVLLDNFKYIRMLDIHVDHATPSGYVCFGSNICSLLTTIDPSKLITLRLKGVCTDSLVSALKTLTCLQELDLFDIQKVSMTTWKTLTLPGSLKRLCIGTCPVSNKFIKDVVADCGKLEKLWLFDCGWLTSQCLIDISKAKSLKHLCLVRIGAREYKFDFGAIGSLQKLKYLQIGEINILGDSFIPPLKSTPITSLTLISMKITDEDLNGIRQLQTLTHVFINKCPLVSGEAFMEIISSLPLLGTIDCDVQLFSEGRVEDFHELFSPLNEMKSLHTINIYHNERKHSEICFRMVTALCWGDWKIWTVNVRSARSSGDHILTFQKV